MPTEPQQTDIVSEARELAPYVQGLADGMFGGKLSRVPRLLHQLADEVERLREFAREFAFEEGDDAEGQVDTLRTFHGKSQYE